MTDAFEAYEGVEPEVLANVQAVLDAASAGDEATAFRLANALGTGRLGLSRIGTLSKSHKDLLWSRVQGLLAAAAT